MRVIKGLLLCSGILLVSCAPSQSTFAPVTNAAGEGVFLEPSRFQVDPSTRRSDMLRLVEDIIRSMPSNFPSNLIRLDPDRGEAVTGALVFLSGDVKEIGKEFKGPITMS